MLADVDEPRLNGCIDVLYDAAASPDLWPVALERLAKLFNGGFVDIFTRSHDREHCNGLAYGLDRSDYDDVFLGFWFKRNVWGLKKPVQVAGEVVSTRRLLDPAELRRSEIYNEYLRPRGLHEGLRLSLWVGETELQDISILRPWSHGPFGPSEEALGRILLPHLQRAAGVTRRLRGADFRRETGSGGPGSGQFAVIAFDRSGLPFWTNVAAERLLAEEKVLRLSGGRLQSPSPACSRALGMAIAEATGAAGSPRRATTVSLVGAGSGVPSITVLPVSNPADWSLSRPPAAVAYLRLTGIASLSPEALRRSFALTNAEAELALALMGGRTIRAIAAERGRSVNTMRNHLARLMEKTGTRKQAELIRLLDDAAALGPN